MIIEEAISDGLKLSVSRSCQALEVSRSGCYKWLRHLEMNASVNNGDIDLRNQIQDIAPGIPWLWLPKDNRRTP
jgi:hypothetical protein